MVNLAAGFVCSFLIVFLIVRSSRLHGGLSLDHDLGGIQKNHAYAVPRVGGIGIACALVAVVLCEKFWFQEPFEESVLLLACAIPAFASGVVEDLTKRVSPRVRLICTLLSALCGALLLNAVVNRVDVPVLDHWLTFAPLAIGITMLGVGGFANAINIIDGFNGLAAGVSMAIIASIGFVAYSVGDELVLSLSLIMLGALGGFLFWNFPTPSVFLGDGGAYLTGFVIAELLILLVARHPTVSAWYAMVVAIYPTFETLFSIYRRKVSGGRDVGQPDGLHLHTLVFRRIVRRGASFNQKQRTRRNSRTSVYLWALNCIAVLPATLWWDSPAALAATLVVFVTSYVSLYVAIVHFRTPRWLIFAARARAPASIEIEPSREVGKVRR
jgi:UDP-N-acetylmuramyl pentapeptide phosphotransferase/UDP-N-acetylglucosamine-1-phosphate transferase